MSWMIAELVIVDNISNSDQTESYQATHVRTLLPEPAVESVVSKIGDTSNKGTYDFLGSITGTGTRFLSTP